MSMKTDVNELGQCSKRHRSKRKCRHLQRYNSLLKDLRQNFRGGHYSKKKKKVESKHRECVQKIYIVGNYTKELL
jgi:hypothetical protein